MQPPPANGASSHASPIFHVMDPKPPRPAAILLAVLIAAGAIFAVSIGLGHSKARHIRDGSSGVTRSAGVAGAPAPDDEDDDPSQVDTIVLGDAADAPVPARRGSRFSDVHATVLVRLPRFGPQIGLIPDSPAGHLLYGWLAAFNQGSYPALQTALPNVALASTGTAQMAMRQQTGGFKLLSAKEVQPGVLVFRLRDQTPLAIEVLGTLFVRPGSSPAAIASFSLRTVPPLRQNMNEAVSASQNLPQSSLHEGVQP